MLKKVSYFKKREKFPFKKSKTLHQALFCFFCLSNFGLIKASVK